MLLSHPIRTFTKFAGIGAVGLLLVGCVPVETYQAERLKADQLAEQLGHSQTQINEANAQRDAAQRQLAAMNNNGAGRDAIIANLTSQNADLQKQNDIWSQKYADAMGLLSTAQVNGKDALPEPLTNELNKFAEQNPDLVEFDRARGVVKFKSDVTFAVGDATVSPKVKEVIGRFASILNSAGADGYELLVAGHTDSTPVTNPLTIKHGHFDNWYLSAHRAIAVGEELIKDGVNSKRMGMLGYSDKRPVASNASEAGKSQNRRVEVLILPTTVQNTSAMASGAEPKAKRSSRTPAAQVVPASATMGKESGVTYTK